MWAIYAGIGLMAVSLFGPWTVWTGTGEVQGLSGNDAKGTMFVAVAVCVGALVARRKTSLRPQWLYAGLALVGIYAWIQIGNTSAPDSSMHMYPAMVIPAWLGATLVTVGCVVAFVSAIRADKGALPQALTRGKVCPRCAESVRSAAVVCRYCGYEFPAREELSSPTTGEEAAQESAPPPLQREDIRARLPGR
jgi:hypothetical protein